MRPAARRRWRSKTHQIVRSSARRSPWPRARSRAPLWGDPVAARGSCKPIGQRPGRGDEAVAAVSRRGRATSARATGRRQPLPDRRRPRTGGSESRGAGAARNAARHCARPSRRGASAGDPALAGLLPEKRDDAHRARTKGTGPSRGAMAVARVRSQPALQLARRLRRRAAGSGVSWPSRGSAPWPARRRRPWRARSDVAVAPASARRVGAEEVGSRRRHISTIVRSTPSRSQRRPEVVTRARRQAGGDRRLRRRDSAMSSISAMSGKPPAASKASRVTKIAWSPVAMPVRRERRFISAATTRSSGCPPSIRTSKRPQCAAPLAPRPSSDQRVGVGRQRACRRAGTAARRRVAAARAGVHLRGAAARRREHPVGAAGAASATVPSRLPPSTTITSAPRARSGASAVERRGDAGGLVEDRHDDGEAAHAAVHSAASFRAPPQLDPWPAVQP